MKDDKIIDWLISICSGMEKFDVHASVLFDYKITVYDFIDRFTKCTNRKIDWIYNENKNVYEFMPHD